ncbi:MAG: helix-hairpin-helix domain-containing protein [Acetobacteraceae bacterium]
MPFPPDQRATLLRVKGIGPTVIARLEQMGFHSLAQLREAEACDILALGAALTGSTCWRNSPRARAAIEAAVALARAAD